MAVVSFSILFLVAAAAVVLTVAFGIVLIVRSRSSRRAIKGPVCGACGYQLAPNPGGLTVCPECGGDFLNVGILTPGMKLGRRANPAVPLGIAWFILVAGGMVPFYWQLERTCTKTMSSGTVVQTLGGNGPFQSLSVTASRKQIVGESEPDTLTADVTLTGQGGKSVQLTIDGKQKTVVKAPAATGLQGAPWDQVAVKKSLAALGRESPDDSSVKRVHDEVDDAMSKSAGGSFGGMAATFSSSSSSSGITFAGRSRSREFIANASSSRFSGGTSPVVVIGPLRGAHWLVVITSATGLLLVFVGLWVIVLLTRDRR